MREPIHADADHDPHDLRRFVDAQRDTYQEVLREIREGRKRSHWMWYVFPQLQGLGFSATSRRYAIKDIAEARAYLEHPMLGPRLVECFEAVLASDRSARDIFDYPDDMKLQSCATLFAAVAPDVQVFQRVIADKFACQRDQRTLDRLGAEVDSE